jgi:O-antigen/teichoic acid export membrane protein
LTTVSVTTSALATTASRLYVAVLGLIAMPWYARLLGEEAYGLVALFLLLQAWFQIFDLGFTAALTREAARQRAGALSARALWGLVVSLEALVWGLGVAAAGVLWWLADPLARHWLQLEGLSPESAAFAIRLMVVCTLLRLGTELYRGLLAGSERLVWLAGSAAAFGSLRLLGVLPFLVWAGPSPMAFFVYHLAVALLEVSVLRAQAMRRLPAVPGWKPTPAWEPVQRVLGLSLAMSLATLVWALSSQVDKLVLSGLLSLKDFGGFSLATTAAAAVLLATGALGDSLVPRLTALMAAGSADDLRRLYRQATQIGGVLAWSVAAWLAFHAESVLWVWTGQSDWAEQWAPVVVMYALGNAALALSAFPFYLQLAHGQLRLHVIGTGCMAILLVPVVWWAADAWGAPGASAAWLGANLMYLLLWTPLSHRRFAPGLHRSWLLDDVLPPALLALTVGWGTSAVALPQHRGGAAALLLLTMALIVLASAAGSTSLRQQGMQHLARWRPT